VLFEKVLGRRRNDRRLFIREVVDLNTVGNFAPIPTGVYVVTGGWLVGLDPWRPQTRRVDDPQKADDN
jgi:hypothetical protein